MNSGSGSRRRLPLLVAAVAGVVLVVVVRQLVAGGGKGGDGSASGPRSGCVTVRVAASSEKAALLSQIADDYNRTNRKVNGGCVDVRVASKASGAAAEALARGWDEQVDGPRPDVWSPASRSWTVLLRQRIADKNNKDDKNNNNDIVPKDTPSIAQTPLVIAMPRPMAEALGWPRTQLGWSDVLALSKNSQGWGAHGHPEWGAFKLGKTNPNYSTSGLNATVATYFAATGLSADLTTGDVASTKATDYVRAVEHSVVHYGDTTLTFLSNLYAAGERGQGLNYVSAVTVEEKSVWDYNEGNPSGDPATLGKQPKPKVPLVAIYPKEGTLVSDNPFVVLRAGWVDDTKRAGAADFLNYVREPAQQKRFTDAAFRSFDGKPGPVLSEGNGLLPKQAYTVIDPPAPAVLDQVARSWEKLRKRARVLVVMDVSGSMGAEVGNTRSSKLDLAKRAARTALGQLQPDDLLGLWTFSTPQGSGAPPYQELIAPAPVKQISGEYARTVDNLVPQGQTALYRTIQAAAVAGRSSYDPDKINAVVVLTDGQNTYEPEYGIDQLLADLSAEDTERTVRVFPIAYGAQSDLGVLQRIGAASRATAYDAQDPATIEKVMVSVFSNF